ncbi:MAG: Lrp/AsnC family transcriptional regulator [Bacteroidetes bacterium]|nr:Lrp/AsnC family transcriptional regulator [Bacteroidota bacterium]
MEKLDKLDKQILKLLQKDCSLNTKQIADKVGLTITPTYERIKRMEKTGVIQNYVALLNKEKVGKSLMIFCNVSLQLHSKPLLKRFEQTVVKFDEVMECYHTAGTFDYLLKVVATDMNNYQDFITNKLAALENISHVQSSFVMTEVKYKTEIRLDY